MKKMYTGNNPRLDPATLAERGWDITDSPNDADLFCTYLAPPPDCDPARTILMQGEPPITPGRVALYERAAEFMGWVTFSPKTANAIAFSDAAPHMLPYPPRMELRVRRDDSELCRKGRGIYFAGHKRPAHKPDAVQCGVPIIYHRRARWASRLMERLGGRCVGAGWTEQTKDAPGGWGASKFADLAAGDFDFHFCAENCIMRGYISEKFWHGLLSDRVAVYMGHCAIKRAVDPSAYVFADDFATPDDLADYLLRMTPRQYRAIIAAARGVLDDVGDRPEQELRRLTARVCDMAEKVRAWDGIFTHEHERIEA